MKPIDLKCKFKSEVFSKESKAPFFDIGEQKFRGTLAQRDTHSGILQESSDLNFCVNFPDPSGSRIR